MIRVQCSIYHLLADTCSARIDLKTTSNTGTAYSGELKRYMYQVLPGAN